MSGADDLDRPFAEFSELMAMPRPSGLAVSPTRRDAPERDRTNSPHRSWVRPVPV